VRYRLEHIDHFPTLAKLKPPRTMVVTGWMIMISIALAAVIMAFVPWVQTANGDGQGVALNPDDRAADVAALNMNVEIAKFSGGNPNAFYPLPAQKLFSASFDRTSDVVGVTVAWFTLTIDLSAGFCPQLLKNSFVWMQLFNEINSRKIDDEPIRAAGFAMLQVSVISQELAILHVAFSLENFVVQANSMT
jgi:hypothetical protein